MPILIIPTLFVIPEKWSWAKTGRINNKLKSTRIFFMFFFVLVA
jgi:hypothetical protein